MCVCVCLICVISNPPNGAMQIRMGFELAECMCVCMYVCRHANPAQEGEVLAGAVEELAIFVWFCFLCLR